MFIRAIVVFLTAGVIIGSQQGCSDDSRRLDNTLDGLSMASPAIEAHLRQGILAARRETLTRPQLLLVRYCVFPYHEDDPIVIDNQSDIETSGAEEIEVIAFWIESEPTADGIRLKSQIADVEWTGAMSPAQVLQNEDEATRSVLFVQAHRVNTNSEDGRLLWSLLQQPDITATLTRDGKDISVPTFVNRDLSCGGSFRSS